MEEKKKRFRPTLTAFRALENEVSKLKEELAKNKWMEKCGIPQSDEATKIEPCQLRSENDKIKQQNRTLEQSNRLMEKELERVRDANKELSKIDKQLCEELQQIKSRGFWDRVFNR